jgi:hypothetical protein
MFTKNPVSTPAIIPTEVHMIKAMSGPREEFCSNKAHVVPLRAITEAIERSIPPLPMTKVTPSASKPITVEADKILSKLEYDKKYGERNVNMVVNAPSRSKHRKKLICSKRKGDLSLAYIAPFSVGIARSDHRSSPTC